MKNQMLLFSIMIGIGVIIGILLKSQTTPETQQAIASPIVHAPAKQNGNQTIPAVTATPTIQSITISGLEKQVKELTKLANEQLQINIDQQIKIDSLEEIIQKTPLNSDNSTATNNTNIGQQSRVFRTHNRDTSATRSQSAWINKQALIDAGISDSEAEQIRQNYEDVEMEKLYLQDRAMREGWTKEQRFRDEMSALNNKTHNLKNELNENSYDAFLYATGRPNRVIVESTLSNSPASKAGIQSGSSILRYDNIKVYSWSDLRGATTKCQTGSSVKVELEYENVRSDLYVPCGPLGVRIDNASIPP